MKTNILAILCMAPALLVQPALAGVNGTYNVTGSESVNGGKYRFTGTVQVSNYRKGTYKLKFNDGDKARHEFTFDKPLSETTASQTVTARNNKGTSTATFYSKTGRNWVKFSYKSHDGSVRGQGSGSK